ncbi:MAG: MarR family winged helix-turn-helix transcriptional regulator [Thermoleophilaceae bacterium]
MRPEDGPGLPPGSRDLDTKLVAALERIGQALRVELRAQATSEGLTLTQAQILLRLVSERAARRRVGALAAALDVRQPTISDAVAALERKGLLERRPHAGDARAATLALTARGRVVGDRLGGWDERARVQLRRLPEQARQASLTLLLDLIAGLQRAGVVGVARTCPTCRFFAFEARLGAAKPHRCALLDMPLGPGELRLDCPEHEQSAA